MSFFVTRAGFFCWYDFVLFFSGDGIGIREQRPDQPIAPLSDQLDLKLDKKGLGIGGKQNADLSQLVGMLNNICWDRHWKMPTYDLISESGPPHAKQFLFRIVFNGEEYKAKEPGSTKKIGKALAAKVCMEALDLI